MSIDPERWLAVKPLVYQQIAAEIQRNALYEQNCPKTWDMLGTIVRALVDPLVHQNYIWEYQVVCNDTVNNKETLEANEFHLEFLWRLGPDEAWTEAKFAITPKGMVVEAN